MKIQVCSARRYAVALTIAGVLFGCAPHLRDEASSEGSSRESSVHVEAARNLVISQVYAGTELEGRGKATNAFLEIMNRGVDAQSLRGASLVFTPAGRSAGKPWKVALPEVDLAASSHYLVRFGDAATDDADLVVGGQDGGEAPKLASEGLLVLSFDDDAPTDALSFGDAATPSEGHVAPALTRAQALRRKETGCQATLDNAADFELVDPTPRDSHMVLTPCRQAGSGEADAGDGGAGASDAGDAGEPPATNPESRPSSPATPDDPAPDPPALTRDPPPPGPPPFVHAEEPPAAQVPAPADTASSDKSGCSAAPAGNASPVSGILAAFALIAGALRRRRRVNA